MRVRGGFNGILAAIDAGWLDPLDPWLPGERAMHRESQKSVRQNIKRARSRAKDIARRSPF